VDGSSSSQDRSRLTSTYVTENGGLGVPGGANGRRVLSSGREGASSPESLNEGDSRYEKIRWDICDGETGASCASHDFINIPLLGFYNMTLPDFSQPLIPFK